MDIINTIRNIYLPETILLIFLVINIIFSSFIKNNKYLNSKNISIIACIISFVSIFYSQVEQNIDNSGILISNIYTVTFKYFILISAFLSISIISQNKQKSFSFFNYLLLSIVSSFTLISSNELICSFLSFLVLNIATLKIISLKDNKVLVTQYKYLIGILSILSILGIFLIHKLTGTTFINEINNVVSVISNNILFLISGLCILLPILIFIGNIPFGNIIKNIINKTTSGISLYIFLIPIVAYISFLTRIFVFIYAYNPILQLILLMNSLLVIVLSLIGLTRKSNMKEIYSYLILINISIFIIEITSTDVFSISTIIFGIFAYIFVVTGILSFNIMLGTRYQSSDIDCLTGLFNKQPAIAIAYIFCLISLIGLPPTSGFITRIYQAMSLSRIDIIYQTILVILLIILPLAIIVYCRIIRRMFYNNSINLIGTRMFLIHKLVLYLCSVITLLIFIFPDELIKLSQIIAYYM